MPDSGLLLLILIVILGLGFDFINGFHDTANAIATSVATRVLSPGQAVLMAATLNVVGALTGTAVASTIGKGIISPQLATQQLVISALVGAIIWNLITWWKGLPSSSSHALVFAIVGAGIAAGGVNSIESSGVTKVLEGMVTSPLLGVSTPVSIFSVVDLPAPFGPMYPSISPRATVRSTPATAATVRRMRRSNPTRVDTVNSLRRSAVWMTVSLICQDPVLW